MVFTVKYFELGDQWKEITFVKTKFAARIMTQICRSGIVKSTREVVSVSSQRNRDLKQLEKKENHYCNKKKNPPDANA